MTIFEIALRLQLLTRSITRPRHRDTRITSLMPRDGVRVFFDAAAR